MPPPRAEQRRHPVCARGFRVFPFFEPPWTCGDRLPLQSTPTRGYLNMYGIVRKWTCVCQLRLDSLHHVSLTIRERGFSCVLAAAEEIAQADSDPDAVGPSAPR